MSVNMCDGLPVSFPDTCITAAGDNHLQASSDGPHEKLGHAAPKPTVIAPVSPNLQQLPLVCDVSVLIAPPVSVTPL